MSDFDYDLFVIGGGSGGVRAARMSAQYGARVALAEESRFGGTCVIRGCVPKKLMVYASAFREAFEDAEGFGWRVGEASFDWNRMRTARDREVDRLEGLYHANLEKAGVTTFRQRARLTGPQSVALADGTEISARVILIAVGGRPNALPVEGAEHAIVSDDVFHLERLPESMLIVGGGYIAVEFAGIFNGLGSRVTLTNRSDGVLRGFDEDLRHLLLDEMRQKGIEAILRRTPRRIEDLGDRKRVTYDDGHAIEAETVFAAIGRSPHTEGLGLEAAGVRTGRGGAIAVDAYSRTNIPSIYAVGDVTGRAELTPVAIREGAAFAETVFNDAPTRPDHALIPTAIFSQPEIGTVGLTEDAARSVADVEVYRTRFRPMLHTLSGREEKMLMKLLVDRSSRKVLGVHIMGHGAGEMIQCVGIALKMGATKEDFDRTMAVHPTAAEELVTMRAPAS